MAAFRYNSDTCLRVDHHPSLHILLIRIMRYCSVKTLVFSAVCTCILWYLGSAPKQIFAQEFQRGTSATISSERSTALHDSGLHVSPPTKIITLDSAHDFSIFPLCSILRDESGTMSFSEILRLSEKGFFTNVGSSETIRVRGPEALWVRFTVRNTKLLDWVLIVGNNRIDSVTLYTPNMPAKIVLAEEDYLVSHSGEMTELRSRAMQTKYANFPLVLTDDNTYTFYAKIRAAYLPAIPVFRLIPAEAFTENVRLWEITAFILLGMLLFAGFFNLIPFVIVRDKVYFWYITHIFSLFIVTTFGCTLLMERFIPTMWKPTINAAVQLSTYSIFLQFIRVFLNTKERMPVLLDRLLVLTLTALILVFLMIPLGWGTYYTYYRIPVLSFGGIVCLVIFVIEMLRSRDIATRIYTLTMMIFVLLKFWMYIVGSLHESLFSSAFGVGETMLFSFALSARLTQMREQVVQERKERELAEKLREQERLRNKDLAAANHEISRQNSILEEQSREIELSNAHLNEVILELDAALTDLKETQSQLVASERVAAVGLLTSGVMHEINNPNAAVFAALEQLKLSLQSLHTFFFSLIDETSKESPEALKFTGMTDNAMRMIAIAMEGSSRVKHIVASLRNFTKHQEVGTKSAPLLDELALTIEMFRYQFKNVQVTTEFQGNSMIEANFGEINQVILNLLVNAAQAGATRIAVEGRENAEQKTFIVDVRDNGPGIPQPVLERMFDPFFTTKGAGNSGLGLSISKGIIDKHGAQLNVVSTLGSGTTFTIRFPKGNQV